MRLKPRHFLWPLVVLFLLVGCDTRINSEERPPNIVMIVVDDLGWADLGAKSSFYETPRIDGLADQGMSFDQAYSGCPVCSPSRAQLMTGKNQARLNFKGHITSISRHRYPEKGRIIPPNDQMYLSLDEVTIAEALKPAGYVSANVGKWHLGTEDYWPKAQGFDLNIGGWTHGSPADYFYPYTRKDSDWNSSIPTLHGGSEGEYLTDRLTDEAIRFIRDNQNRPFFLYLPYYSVHTPLRAPQELVQKYLEKRRPESSQRHAVYAAMIERVDQNVGRLAGILDKLGLTEDTIVIFTSDNGGEVGYQGYHSNPEREHDPVTSNNPLRSGKGFLYEGGVRVPLIVRWPGHTKPGSYSSRIVANADLYPTIMDIVGGRSKPGTDLDGESFLTNLLGQDESRKQPLYWYHPHYSKRPGAAMRDENWKLIEFYDPPKIELYDLAEDIEEQRDLAPKMPEKTEELHNKLQQWIKDTGTLMHTLNPAYNSRRDPEIG